MALISVALGQITLSALTSNPRKPQWFNTQHGFILHSWHSSGGGGREQVGSTNPQGHLRPDFFHPLSLQFLGPRIPLVNPQLANEERAEVARNVLGARPRGGIYHSFLQPTGHVAPLGCQGLGEAVGGV